MSTLPADVVARLGPWSGTAYAHVEAGMDGARPDIDALSRQPDGRWNDPDDATLYFAGDPAVALSELARHMPPDERATTRELLRFRLDLQRVLDVRAPQVCERLGVEGAPLCFLDRDEARAIARRLRESGRIDAIRVPPMAFLGQPERWNLVAFVDRLAEGWLAGSERVATLEVRPNAEGARDRE